jgi:hypothetical protein
MANKRPPISSLGNGLGRDQRPKPCGARLTASVYPSRMLAFTLIPGYRNSDTA